jgi:hypothetical protein
MSSNARPRNSCSSPRAGDGGSFAVARTIGYALIADWPVEERYFSSSTSNSRQRRSIV